jgi:hypothetical protein
MSEKSAGIDFDRQVFVQDRPPLVRPTARLGGVIFALAIIIVVAFVGYKLLPQPARESGNTSDAALAELDKRLADIEGRLEKLESTRKAVVPSRKEEAADPKQPAPTAPRSAERTVYQVSPAPRQVRTGVVPAPGPDPATAQRLAAFEQGLGSLQNDAAASHDAWQATTDKLANMAGQVGTQGVEILRSQDELNQLLARTEMEAIPFELLRGSNPQPVGPVSLLLKSANPKTQRYTVCVYIQPSCVELKDRTLNEVVQFVVARNSTPLELIATRMTKEEIVGYLEVPRNQSGH